MASQKYSYDELHDYDEPRVDAFFDALVQSIQQQYAKQYENLVFIVVAHIVPTLPFLLRAASQLATASLLSKNAK